MNSDDVLVEKFGEMPDDIQELILSEQFKQDVHTIAQKYGLRDQKESALAAEVVMVIFGITSIGELPQTLREELSIDLEDTENLVPEIDQTVFSKVRASLNQVQGLQQNGSSQEPPQKAESPVEASNQQRPEKAQPQVHQSQNQPPQKPKRRPGKQPDPYREPIDDE